MDNTGRRVHGDAMKAALRAALAFAGITCLPSAREALAQAPAVTAPDAPAGRSWTAPGPSQFDPLNLAWNDGRWWVTGFSGVVAKNYISHIARLHPDFGGTYTVGASLGREWARWEPWLRFEWEVSASLQFGQEWSGDFRAMPLVRFVAFPWNHYIFTTAAIGWGPSWMTSKSRYEQQDDSTRTHRLNSAMTFEITIADPARPDWMGLLRVNHRSPLLGYLKDHGDDTDFVTLGVKHRF